MGVSIYLNKKEIEAIDYAIDKLGSEISDDETVNAKNSETSDVLIGLLSKIRRNTHDNK